MNEHRDLQVTIHYDDGSEFTWTVLRDHDMRWLGDGTLPARKMTRITAEWFDNKPKEIV